MAPPRNFSPRQSPRKNKTHRGRVLELLGEVRPYERWSDDDRTRYVEWMVANEAYYRDDGPKERKLERALREIEFERQNLTTKQLKYLDSTLWDSYKKWRKYKRERSGNGVTDEQRSEGFETLDGTIKPSV
jgi:uncharacterized protein YjiS (DUF1127 family)